MVLKWLNLHITLSGLYLVQDIVRKRKMQVGLTLSVIKQAVLHFNKVLLPISALLCKNLMPWFSCLYKCNETQQKQTWSKAQGAYSGNTSKKQLTTHTLCTKAAARAVPQPCQQLGSTAQNKQAHMQPFSPAHLFQSGKSSHFYIGKKSSLISPSETLKCFHFPSQSWCSEAGWFLRTMRY